MVEIEAVAQDPESLLMSYGGHSTAGLKSENQDAFGVLQPESSVRLHKGVAAAIADGVSSCERGGEASQICVTDFINEYYSTPDTWTVKESAARVINALNTWLNQHGICGSAGRSDMVTTFSAVIFKSNSAHIFHVGDSRIYRFRGSSLEQLTHDHSGHGTGDKQVLINAMGMDVHIEVDYLREDLEPGDIFVLTTDGVHDFLEPYELKRLLCEDVDSLESHAQLISNNAINKGSNDNLSCLLMKVDTLPNENLNEAHRKLASYAVPPVMEPEMSIDGYKVVDILHTGTRSHLYLVEKDGLDQRLVLKAPSLNFSDDVHYLESFIREQWIGQRIKSPNVMKVYPRPANTRFIYNLYEYIPSQDLRQWMCDNPKPSIANVRSLLKQISTGLRAFQRLSMVHRDLKPENILIDKYGRIKLIDFGTVQVSGLQEIATAINEECPVGSLNYIAPEYLMGEQGAMRSDIFSLGVIVYELLCGELPFKSPLYRNQIPKGFSHWKYRPIGQVRDDIPAWVDGALKKATEPSPENRYEVLSEFCHDLRIPNSELILKKESSPLLEHNPLLFWKLLSAVLAVLLLWQLIIGKL